MKKFLALLLAMLMVFSLVACGGGKDTDDGSKNNNDSSSANNDSANDDNDTADDGAASSGDGDVTASDAGYPEDAVDHKARDEYKFVYAFTASSALTDSMMNSWALMKDQYNFTVTESTGEGDQEAFIQNLEVILAKGIDGLFLDCDPTIHTRCLEIVEEFDIPFICMFNTMTNSDGAAIAPALALNQYQSGYDAIDYYCQNYKEWWGDVDDSKVALLNLDWSTSPPLTQRCEGAADAFLNTFPNGSVITSDGVTIGHINAETGYDMASQNMAAHPEIEYWMIIGCVEDYVQGAARYVETLPTQDNVLITTVGSTLLPVEWDSGYEGAWKSCYAIADMAYAGPAACGLIALCDGRATVETLWADKRADGDFATVWIADSIIMTHDNYAGYMQSYNSKYVTE